MLKKLVRVGVPAFGLAATSAFAAVPVAVTDALAEAKDDAIAVASLVLVVYVAIAAFRYMRAAIR